MADVSECFKDGCVLDIRESGRIIVSYPTLG